MKRTFANTAAIVISITISLSVLTATSVYAQTKPKQTTSATVKPAAKPVAKPAAKPATAPAAKPATASAAKPATAPAEKPVAQTPPPVEKKQEPKKFQNVSSETFNKGTVALNLGIGFGTIYGIVYKPTIPPVSAMLEFGIVDNLFKNGKGAIGVGPYAGYSSYKAYGEKLTRILGTVRGNFHYQFVDKLDTYAGVQAGYDYLKWNSDVISSGFKSSGVFVGGIVGARYYFAPSFAVMAELGYSIAYANVGVTLKF
jgi:hypothetical protein